VILATTGLIQISLHTDLKGIFIAIGIITIVAAIILFFGIKDIIEQKNKLPYKQPSLK
jgi:uncharacterized membrane protein YidH (DUF202 family)